MVKTNPGEIRYPARQDPAQGVGHADDGHQERCVLHTDTVLGKEEEDLDDYADKDDLDHDDGHDPPTYILSSHTRKVDKRSVEPDHPEDVTDPDQEE